MPNQKSEAKVQELGGKETPRSERAGGPSGTVERRRKGARGERLRGARAEATRLVSASWALPAASRWASNHEDQASELAHLLRRGHALQLLLLLHLQADSNL